LRPAHVFAKALRRRRTPNRGPAPRPLAFRPAHGHDLSLRGLTAAEIAVPFEYDPHTVRRWINPLQGQGRVGIGGPSALGCTSPGERRARRTHPDAAEAAGGLDGQAATPSPGLPGDVAGDPGPASPRAGQLAPAAAGGEGATPRRPLSWRALHQEIATLPEGAVILAEDESHVNLLPWLRSTWIVKGDRQEVMTPGTNGEAQHLRRQLRCRAASPPRAASYPSATRSKLCDIASVCCKPCCGDRLAGHPWSLTAGFRSCPTDAAGDPTAARHDHDGARDLAVLDAALDDGTDALQPLGGEPDLLRLDSAAGCHPISTPIAVAPRRSPAPEAFGAVPIVVTAS
jgi:hypothetical protein